MTIAFFGRRSGLSLVELIMTLSILSILAALILPSAQMMAKRTKEIELRRSLRVIRNAIDDFKKTYDKGVLDKKISSKSLGKAVIRNLLKCWWKGMISVVFSRRRKNFCAGSRVIL